MASSMLCGLLCAFLVLWTAISASEIGPDWSVGNILKRSPKYLLDADTTNLKGAFEVDASVGNSLRRSPQAPLADGDTSYDYSDGPLGPANWGNLNPEWRLCSDGQSQSPIDINKTQVSTGAGSGMATFYRLAIVELVFNHGIQINWRFGGGSLYWNDEGPYKVQNIHWHTPSEHTINGERFPLESHIVHLGPNGEILVVGRLYTLGAEDSFLQSVMEWESSNTTLNYVKLNNIKTNYFNYMGSLTTPPCTEGVTWIVRDQIITASKEQVDFITYMNEGNNSRPLQPLNGRSIYLYEMNDVMMVM